MRFETVSAMVSMALASALFAGCGQDEITLPELGGQDVGECGAFYPGGGAADSGIVYGAESGDTLPCFVWESVRAGAQDGAADPATYANAYLSMGEILLKSKSSGMGALLQAQFGVAQAVVAENCSGCPEFLGRTVASLPELQAEGVIVIGVASFSSNNSDPSADAMDLVAADEILATDGFDPSLYRTNDPEHYLGTNGSFGEGFPQILAVRVSDMVMAVRGLPQAYYPSTGEGLDVAKLVDEVEAFSAP